MKSSFSYRCRRCGEITWARHEKDEHPRVKCEMCGSQDTQKVIIQVPNMKRVLTPMGHAHQHAEE